VEALFESIDLDGSGVLDAEEAREFFRALHLHYRYCFLRRSDTSQGSTARSGV
jgi:hypothetical protein